MIEEAAAYGGENQEDARFALALVYNREKRYEEALKELELLRSRYPRNRLAHIVLDVVQHYAIGNNVFLARTRRSNLGSLLARLPQVRLEERHGAIDFFSGRLIPAAGSFGCDRSSPLGFVRAICSRALTEDLNTALTFTTFWGSR